MRQYNSPHMNAAERANQRNAVLAGFLGWTLDAFDFFVLTFVISGRRDGVRQDAARHRADRRAGARHAPHRRDHLRPHRGSLRPAAAADAQRHLLRRHLGALRLRAELHDVRDPAAAVRHRHGRRVGRRRVARARVGVAAAARAAVRPAAGRLRAGQSARGAGVPRRLRARARGASRLRLARDVLPRRRAGAAVVVHPRACEGVRRVARTSRRLADVSHVALEALAALSLSRPADDDDDVHVARHAGHVSRRSCSRSGTTRRATRRR